MAKNSNSDLFLFIASLLVIIGAYYFFMQNEETKELFTSNLEFEIDIERNGKRIGNKKFTDDAYNSQGTTNNSQINYNSTHPIHQRHTSQTGGVNHTTVAPGGHNASPNAGHNASPNAGHNASPNVGNNHTTVAPGSQVYNTTAAPGGHNLQQVSHTTVAPNGQTNTYQSNTPPPGNQPGDDLSFRGNLGPNWNFGNLYDIYNQTDNGTINTGKSYLPLTCEQIFKPFDESIKNTDLKRKICDNIIDTDGSTASIRCRGTCA